MKKKNKLVSYGIGVLFIILLGIMGYISISDDFEKENPTIIIGDDVYWNLKQDFKITLTDKSGIKYYRIVLKDDDKETVLESNILKEPNQRLDLNIKPPKIDMFFKGNNVSIVVEAIDNSKWNFFNGNEVKESFKVKIDTKKPIANVISNTLAIRRGGSAIAVFEVRDENLKDFYVSFNNDIRFKPIPFYKEGFYACMIAWPVDIIEFKRVNLIAVDKADNITRTKIPLYARKLKVKKDKINITDSFIEDVSTSVLTQMNEKVPTDLVDRFIYENRDLRNKNLKTIKDIVEKNMDYSIVSKYNIKAFRRLRGSKTVAGFAERRSYYYNKVKIDEAWHLGIDWASVKKAKIYCTNQGKVIYKDFLGIYGNTIIIDHGLGLSTLYAHTSNSDVDIDDKIKAKQKIGNTGNTGAVFGDHLHFGVLVNGIEVNPKEWMDKSWIKTRILDILKDGKKAIDQI